MPIYEYSCTHCGHELEVLQKMSDAPLRDCPACHQPTLKKLISAVGFQLKGSGWYETDFKGKTKQPAPAACEAKQTDSASPCTSGQCPATASSS